MVSAGTWVLAIVLYLAVTCLIVWRAVATPFVPEGVTPDSWILMGALAISILAGVRLFAAFRAAGVAPWCADVVGPVIVVLWVLASVWIPVLLYAQVWRIHLRSRSMRYAAVWWSAVFPLGKYSAATQATAVQMHLGALIIVSLVLLDRIERVVMVAVGLAAFGAVSRSSPTKPAARHSTTDAGP